jgi:dynein assembly factor 1
MEVTGRRRAAEPPKDENGKAYLTEEYIMGVCEENGGYTTPYLNDILYLHYKGFSEIQCLDKYKNIKCLWLESNGLQKIRGLENNKKLRMIFLQQNMIREIENVSHLKKLVKLNLSNNMITKISGLKGLDELQTLQLNHNNIGDVEDCQDLLELPSLTSLELKNNKLDKSDTIVPFFSKLTSIYSLYL